MYKLYNVKGWGSICLHLMLEEMEVPYTNIWMTPEQVRTPEFRQLSPLGFIPALGLQDGRTLFESAAIVTFLITAHPDKGLSPAPGTDDFGEFLSWLHFLSANIYPAISMSEHGSAFAATSTEAAHIEAAAAAKTDELWALVEKRLDEEGPWMMGEGYSALDVYAFMLALWGKPNEAALLGRFPKVAQLSAGVRARPRLKAALEAHGILNAGGQAA